MQMNGMLDHEEAILRIAMEYLEMPDLKLTRAQARRLWNYPADVCDRALSALVARGFLVRTATGAFLRDTGDRPAALRQAP
jgi:hypothetical protein